MKLKLSLMNLVRSGLNFLLILCLLSGCSSSTTPTFLKEDVAKAIQDICKDEYKLEVKTKLIGMTLWIYLPVEDLLEKADKPEKYIERYVIDNNTAAFKDKVLELGYSIKPVPEQEKSQEYKYSKTVLEKMNNVWKVLRRVLFSMKDVDKTGPKFFFFVISDTKNGLEIRDIFYYLDLKKVSYDFISWTEYQHRSIEESDASPLIIGDNEGSHLKLIYKDITLDDFVMWQIQHRIKLKFQKPEVQKNADIDKEILKIATYTIKTYGLKNFQELQLNNLITQNRIIFSRAAVWERPLD